MYIYIYVYIYIYIYIYIYRLYPSTVTTSSTSWPYDCEAGTKKDLVRGADIDTVSFQNFMFVCAA